MAIIVLDVNLPQNCWHCRAAEITSKTEDFGRCFLIGELGSIYENDRERHPRCPLRPYPPKPTRDPWDGEKPHAPAGFWEKYCAPYDFTEEKKYGTH